MKREASMQHPSVERLEKIDIVLSIFNQERLIARVLSGILRNTITPFNLILVFDGCTDESYRLAMNFLAKLDLAHTCLEQLIVTHAPNVYETRANNIGLRLAREPYVIIVQDDMVIHERAWERRLTYPLRKFPDFLAVTSRGAQNVMPGDGTRQVYANTVERSMGLPRTICAVRDVINRGPIAFRTSSLKTLGYFNESFAPGGLDDADLSLRAWRDYRWRCGAFWIDYESRLEWGKTRSADSTMQLASSEAKNTSRLYNDHADYIRSNQKHDEDIFIDPQEVDDDIQRFTDNLQVRYGAPPSRAGERLMRRMLSTLPLQRVPVLPFLSALRRRIVIILNKPYVWWLHFVMVWLNPVTYRNGVLAETAALFRKRRITTKQFKRLLSRYYESLVT